MKNNDLIILALMFLFILANGLVHSQNPFLFEQSVDHPFGKPNPEAPKAIQDFTSLIGSSKCNSISRKADQSWDEPVEMIWNFKYIMNGMAIQDETLKADGSHSGSIRQYSADSSRWYVHYYNSASPSASLPTWEGNLDDDNEIILYREQKAPNGMDGYYKLRFYDIEKNAFNWEGAWVNPDETILYPTWKIKCQKVSE